MTCKDLMVGDYVQIKNVGLIIKITEIDGTYDAVNYFNKDAEGELTLSIKDIEPISITPEILEKNFPDTEDGVLWWKDVGGMHIETETDGIMMFCGLFHYVHQLQHALQLACIEKDIVI